jgi:hypothetical protein
MTAVYPVIALEGKFDGVNWDDFTADVVSEAGISGSGGIFGNGPLDRVAGIGQLKFTLNNTESNSGGMAGYYSPGNMACRAGFNIGMMVRLQASYRGITKTKFYGRIGEISIQAGKFSERRVGVTAPDFMELAANHELKGLIFAEDLTMPQVVALLLANMTIQPLGTDYRTGEDTFTNIFDTVRSKTRVLGEFAKVALSEMGYIYITRRGGDEALRVEGRLTRNNEAPEVSDISVTGGFLKKEDGGHLLKEDGGRIILNVATPATFDGAMMTAMEVDHGRMLYNRIKATAYPRAVDAAATTILFTLQSPVYIAAGETLSITGRYRDPAGGTSNVSGIEMVAPAATTDYLMNTVKGGGGTDLTDYLQVIHPASASEYGTGDVVYTLKNTHGSLGGWVNLLQARGKGVYIYDAIDYTVEDSDSIELIGPQMLVLDMKYQTDLLTVAAAATIVLARYKDARTIMEKATFVANMSDFLMMAFLQVEPGDRVYIPEEVSGINADFYINGMEFEIRTGNLCSCSWYVRDAGLDSYNFAVWDVDVWDDPDKTWGF